MRGHDIAAVVQPQAEILSGFLGGVIRLKDVFFLAGGHAAAVIGNGENRLMLTGNDTIGKRDAPGRAYRLKCVGEQVFQNFAQMRRVTIQRLGVALVDANRSSGGRRGTFDDLLQQTAHGAKLGHENNLLGICARAVDELTKMVNGAFDDLRFAVFRGRGSHDG